MDTKISIITTTFNCINYIEHSINSALGQTLQEIVTMAHVSWAAKD